MILMLTFNRYFILKKIKDAERKIGWKYLHVKSRSIESMLQILCSKYLTESQQSFSYTQTDTQYQRKPKELVTLRTCEAPINKHYVCTIRDHSIEYDQFMEIKLFFYAKKKTDAKRYTWYRNVFLWLRGHVYSHHSLRKNKYGYD